MNPDEVGDGPTQAVALISAASLGVDVLAAEIERAFRGLGPELANSTAALFAPDADVAAEREAARLAVIAGARDDPAQFAETVMTVVHRLGLLTGSVAVIASELAGPGRPTLAEVALRFAGRENGQ